MLLKPVRAPRLLACGLLTLFFAAASHAAPADPFPPPGLYRVDADTTVQQREGTLQTVGNGADGSGFIEGRTARAPRPGARRADHHLHAAPRAEYDCLAAFGLQAARRDGFQQSAFKYEEFAMLLKPVCAPRLLACGLLTLFFATPEDGAAAAAVLQHWDAYVADARGAASEAAQAPRRVEQRSATSLTRLTRIADNCSTTSLQ